MAGMELEVLAWTATVGTTSVPRMLTAASTSLAILLVLTFSL